VERAEQELTTVWGAARALMTRPDLWPAAVIEGSRMMPRRWWRRWPPRLAPDQGYLRFRLEAFYGDAGHRLEPQDLISWLEWCRRLRAMAH
jgi:hypothetical protein